MIHKGSSNNVLFFDTSHLHHGYLLELAPVSFEVFLGAATTETAPGLAAEGRQPTHGVLVDVYLPTIGGHGIFQVVLEIVRVLQTFNSYCNSHNTLLLYMVEAIGMSWSVHYTAVMNIVDKSSPITTYYQVSYRYTKCGHCVVYTLDRIGCYSDGHVEGERGGSIAAEIVATLHLEFVFTAEFSGFLRHSIPFFPTQDFNSLLQIKNTKYLLLLVAEICNNTCAANLLYQVNRIVTAPSQLTVIEQLQSKASYEVKIGELCIHAVEYHPEQMNQVPEGTVSRACGHALLFAAPAAPHSPVKGIVVDSRLISVIVSFSSSVTVLFPLFL